MEVEIGSVIKGYELRERIGRGGFGEVYRAHQAIVEREVAIKIILPEYANKPQFIRRFDSEAQLVARLEHPYIVPLFDYWREPGGAYLVMRLLRGGSLREVLRAKPFTQETILQPVEQIALALMTAHRGGVVHRDIKPQNILFDDDGNAYLTDFGIAKPSGELPDDGITGSLAYMAPEQIRVDIPTPALDQYAFAIVIWEMLTGEHPYPYKNLKQLLAAHLKEPIPDVTDHAPDLPAALNDVLHKATAKEATARYDDMLAFLAAFRQAIQPHSAAALPDIDVSQIPNPYKGLRAFNEADAADFFGRETLVQQMLTRLEADTAYSNFLAVVGPSGSGKSSAVKAGLLPALRNGALDGSAYWYVVDMVPGVDPMDELAAALLSVAPAEQATLTEQLRADAHGLQSVLDELLPYDQDRLVLVIDQFEELFTLVANQQERLYFMDLLRHAVQAPESKLLLLVTLRADFYDRPLLYPEFGAMVQARTQVILPLSAGEIERAITGPAERVGLIAERDLVAAIINDVSDQAGALPLLQYALTELYERREGRYLTLPAYQQSGGVLGALARRAEAVYETLKRPEQALARQMFLRLITLGDGVEDTRRRALRSELVALAPDQKRLQAILDAFSKYRLLTFDREPNTREPTVEVAHEALIRVWERLNNWLDYSRANIRLQRLLAEAASEWRANAQRPDFLLQGGRLAQYADWASTTDIVLTPDERAFLQASLEERARQSAAEEERRNRELQLQQRTRARTRLLTVVGIAALIAIGLTLVALNQSAIARTERDNAEIARITSDANAALAATAESEAEAARARSASLAQAASAGQLLLQNDETDLALALALAANSLPDPPAQAQNVLVQAAYAPGAYRILASGRGAVESVALDATGERALTGNADGSILLWDVAENRILRTLEGHTDFVRDVIFLPDDSALSTSADATMLHWDLNTGEVLQRFEGHSATVNSVTLSPDGTQALTTSEDASLILWDVQTGAQLLQLVGHENAVGGAAFSPDGQTALSASNDLLLWDLESGKIMREFTGNPCFAEGIYRSNLGVAFAPEGDYAVTHCSSEIVVWDVAQASAEGAYRGYPISGTDVAFNADASQVIVGGVDNNVILSDVATGEWLHTYRGHSDAITQLAFSADGRRFISSSRDGSAIVWYWDLQGGAEQVTPLDATIPECLRQGLCVPVADFDLAKQTVALADDESADLVLYDTQTGERLQRFQRPGSRAADAARTFGGGEGITIFDLTFSPDGSHLVTSSASTAPTRWEVLQWNVATGNVVHELDGHAFPAYDAAYSPDGNRILTGGMDTTLMLWDAQSGERLQTLYGHWNPVSAVAFHPDGVRGLSADDSGLIIVWNLLAGQALHTIETDIGQFSSIQFSPDARHALATSGDNLLMLVDVDPQSARFGSVVQQYRGHASRVLDADFSHDGSLIVSGAEDGLVLLWDAATGGLLRTYRGHTDVVMNVAFAEDDRSILSVGGDYAVRQWPVRSVQELIDWIAENRHVRDLTCTERIAYRVTPLCDGGTLRITPTLYPTQQPTATRPPVRFAPPPATQQPTPTVTPDAAAASAPTFSIQPDEIAIGDNITLNASGFAPNEAAILTIVDARNGSLGTRIPLQMDANGHFAQQLPLNAPLQIGPYIFRLDGASGSSAQAELRIVAN